MGWLPLLVAAAVIAASCGMEEAPVTPGSPGRPLIGTCPLAGLRVEAGQAEGAAGHSFQPIVFTNSGDTACEPHDPIGVVVVGPGGVLLPAVIDANLYAGPQPLDGPLEPGESAVVVLETRNACDAGQRSHPVGESFRLVFPGDVEVEVAAPLDPACGIGMSGFTSGL